MYRPNHSIYFNRLLLFQVVFPSKAVGRPGGGGESDAAFTPSPPVGGGVGGGGEQSLSLTLAHQTRIRSLYSSVQDVSSDGSANPILGQRRPDSSSSASSATDWEGNGHATVLRRGAANMPHPLPPLPLPLARKPPPPPGLYDDPPFESHSSDSDFGQGTGKGGIDRLSVRTGISGSITGSSSRKPLLTLTPGEEAGLFTEDQVTSPRLLYFSPQMSENPNQERETSGGQAPPPNNGIQDQILATQLRRLNRESTPTISEVYHERNIGLGLAPPLSKLLLPAATDGESPGGILGDTVTENEKDSGTRESKGKPWLSSAALQR